MPTGQPWGGGGNTVTYSKRTSTPKRARTSRTTLNYGTGESVTVKKSDTRRIAAEKAKEMASKKPRKRSSVVYGTDKKVTVNRPDSSSSSSSTEGERYARDLARKGAAQKAGTEGKRYAEGLARKGRAQKALKHQAAAERRRTRIKSGMFKGKYYGPDEFGGNETVRREWKKAGKPDPKKFLKNRNK